MALCGSPRFSVALRGSLRLPVALRGSLWPSVARLVAPRCSPCLSGPYVRGFLRGSSRGLPWLAPCHAAPLPRPCHARRTRPAISPPMPRCIEKPDFQQKTYTIFGREILNTILFFLYAARLKYMEQGREQSRAYPKVEGSTTSRLACVRGVSAQIVYELEHSRGATAPVSTCIFRRRVRRLGRQVFILIESGPPAKAVEALREEIREGERKWGRSTRRTMGNAERVSSGSPRRKKCFSIGGIAYDH